MPNSPMQGLRPTGYGAHNVLHVFRKAILHDRFGRRSRLKIKEKEAAEHITRSYVDHIHGQTFCY